jgi:hypothetical protein
VDHTSRRSFLQLPVAAACAGVLPIGADAATGPKPTDLWHELPAAHYAYGENVTAAASDARPAARLKEELSAWFSREIGIPWSGPRRLHAAILFSVGYGVSALAR